MIRYNQMLRKYGLLQVRLIKELHLLNQDPVSNSKKISEAETRLSVITSKMKSNLYRGN